MEGLSMSAEEEKVLAALVKILRQEGPTLPIATICGRYMRANGGRKTSMDIAKFLGKRRPVARFLMRHRKWLEDLGDGRVRLQPGCEGEDGTVGGTVDSRGNRSNRGSHATRGKKDGRPRTREGRGNQRHGGAEDNDLVGNNLACPTGTKEEPNTASPQSPRVPRPILAGADVEFGDLMFALRLREEDSRPPSWTWDESQGPIRSSDIVAIEIWEISTNRRVGPATLFHMPTHGRKATSAILEKYRANKGKDIVYTYVLGDKGTGLPVWLDTEWRAPLIALTPWMHDAPLGNYIDTGKVSGARGNAEALCKRIEFRRIESPKCPACKLLEMRGFIGSRESTGAHEMGQLHGVCPCCDHQCPNCPALLMEQE